VKLLMATHYFESHRSGIELVAGYLARELGRLGQEVTWLASDASPPPGDEEIARAVAVRAHNTAERRLGIPFPIPTVGAVQRIGREVRRADAVLIHDTLYPTNVAAFLFARLAKKPVVIIQHVGVVPYRNPLFRALMGLANQVIARSLLARADRVVFISEITARYFSSVRFRVAPALIFNGVDTAIFRPVASRQLKPALRRRLELPADSPVALFVGRFVEKKGLHILSRMARLRRDIMWVFAGWGPIDPRDWQLPNAVVFSDLSGASLAELYQASDVLVLPSVGEGFPLVIQEALACGLPVVCGAETCGADEAARPYLSGIPVDGARPDASAAAFCAEVSRVVSQQDSDSGLAQERFRFVSERYSWAMFAARCLGLIFSLPGMKGGLESLPFKSKSARSLEV
jgi:glycosyltransferase involved in cell wall biosynthesis